MTGGSVFFQAEDGIRDLVRSRGLGDVYKRQGGQAAQCGGGETGNKVGARGEFRVFDVSDADFWRPHQK